jgi:[ribosomal protein S5]-alanine N-acetyltransferase
VASYFLHSARLGFRRWQESDRAHAIELWGDPQVTRYISTCGFTLQDIEQRLAREIATEREHGLQYWPIFRLENDEHVGCCGLRPRASEPEVPELGFHIASRHWRRGYAFEAASRVIDYAFDVLGTPALFAGHNPQNVASQALLARLGFVRTHDELYPPTGLQHPSYRLRRDEHPRARALR